MLHPINIRLLAILAWLPLTNLETSEKRYGVHKDWEKATSTMQIKKIYILRGLKASQTVDKVDEN